MDLYIYISTYGYIGKDIYLGIDEPSRSRRKRKKRRSHVRPGRSNARPGLFAVVLRVGEVTPWHVAGARGLRSSVT